MNDVFKKMHWQDLGNMPYGEAWALQEDLRMKRIEGNIFDHMLLVEHPPVITLGRRECEDDVISPDTVLSSERIDVVKTNRGGRATYHGPGQLVGYFICELASFGMGIKDFVRSIEEMCILTLMDFGITGCRDDKHPGLWIGKNKIVAIGLNVSHGVTQHGFALNVNCNLNAYKHIVACGINDRGVTSMASLRGTILDMDEVKQRVIVHAGQILLRKMFSI